MLRNKVVRIQYNLSFLFILKNNLFKLLIFTGWKVSEIAEEVKDRNIRRFHML